MGFIYKITNPNGRLYVGKTYDVRKRINSHKHIARKGGSIILANSIRKYGWENHKFEIIEEVADELMDEREIFWISELKTYCYENPGQMNMTKGGEGQRSTWKHDKERIKKASERAKGENNHFYGKTHTKEMKEILSKMAVERNLKSGKRVPEWGAEKGREIIRKPVLCYNNNGELLNEFISLTDAANKLNINISSVTDSLRCDTWVAGKYFFRYKDGVIKQRIEVPGMTYKNIKRPVLTLTSDYEIVCEHDSAQEASDFWGIPKTTINRAAMYNWLVPIRTGHVFIYTDLYEQILAAEQAA